MGPVHLHKENNELTLLKCFSHTDCILYFIFRTARQLSSCNMIAFFIFFHSKCLCQLGRARMAEVAKSY